MSTAHSFTLAGLALDLLGAVLLYFFTVPQKQIGNAVLDGETMYGLNDQNLRDVPEQEWKPAFEKVIKQSGRLTKIGFALLVLGALFQIAGTLTQA